MKLRLVRVPRRPAWPGWAVCVVVLWLGVVQLTAWYAPGFPTCQFKRVTSVPCPACGLTRGVTEVKKGDVFGALAYNPFWMTMLACGAAVLALRFLAGRAVRLEATRRERRWLWTVLVVCLLANWVYVIRYVG